MNKRTAMKKATTMMVLLASLGITNHEGRGETADPCKTVPLEYAQQAVATGTTRQVLKESYDRLCSPPLGELDFALSDVTFRYKRRFTEYSGDISGRMLGALQADAAALGVENPMIEQLAAAFPCHQKADGHFGAEQHLDQGIKGRRDMPILWGNGRLLLAMAERCRMTDDPELLASAKKLGDYVIATRKYFGQEENFEKLGGLYASGFTTCYPSLIDGMVALGEVTGQEKYYEEARHIAWLSLKDSSFEHRHSHGRLTAFRGMLDLDRLTGTCEFTPKVIEACRTIRRELMLPTGGLTERFNREDARDEGCTEADWVRVHFLLWQATGDTQYLDIARFALRNHLMATQKSNGGFGHNLFLPLEYNDTQWPAGQIGGAGAEAYWCCSMHGAQVLADVARWSVVKAKDRYHVTWLGEADAEYADNAKTQKISVQQVAPDQWRIICTADQPTPFMLALQVPGWAETITVDGRKQAGRDGWFELDIDATQKAEIDVSFPNEVQLAGPYGREIIPDAPQRIIAGGDLYGLPEAHLPAGWLNSTAAPRIALAAEKRTDSELPVVVYNAAGDQQCRTTLVPMSQRPWGAVYFLFDIEKTDAAAVAEVKACPVQRIPIEINYAALAQADLFLNGTKLDSRRPWAGEAVTIAGYAQPGTNVVTFKLQEGQPKPGLIALVRTGQKTWATTTESLLAQPCPEPLNQAALSNPPSTNTCVPLVDRGAWYELPQNHMGGDFAGSNARWVWVEAEKADQPRTWLMYLTFELD